MNHILDAIGLQAKEHALAKTLSGGMKRKLSVGIALCAGSKVRNANFLSGRERGHDV